jgi:hypothetical protein
MGFRIETRRNSRRGLARVVGLCTECKQVVTLVPLFMGSDGTPLITDGIETAIWFATERQMNFHRCVKSRAAAGSPPLEDADPI